METKELNREPTASLPIKILSIAGGILSSLAFIGFLFLAGLYNSDTALLFTGILLLAAALWINLQHPKIFLDTICVSLYLLGYMLIGIGIGQLLEQESIIGLVFIVLAVGCLYINQHTVIALLSVLIIHGSILFLLQVHYAAALLPVYLSLLAVLLLFWFLQEAYLVAGGGKLGRLYAPVRTGLALSLLSGLYFSAEKFTAGSFQQHNWISSLVIIGCILYLLINLFKALDGALQPRSVKLLVLVGIILLSTLFAPSITGSLLVILLSFKVNYKTGLVAGIVALVYFISLYYYDLSFTLLTKSVLMMASGILLLLLYYFIQKNPLKDETV